MIKTIFNNLLWSQGKTILSALAAQAILLALLSGFTSPLVLAILGAVLIAETGFAFYFFRNPERISKYEKGETIISPADGRVVAYEQVKNASNYAHKVSIFLSPLDVHVQWIPMSGIVEEVIYKPGKFTPAFLPKSSALNERVDVIISGQQGTILVRQIAGTIARRIVVWIQKKAVVQQGQKYGMIKFGSRVDVFLPAQVTVLVQCGQKVQGGLTALGKWSC